MSVSTPVANVPREASQPPADQLLSYDALMERLTALSLNPRVRVTVIGTSQQGRQIPLIAITSPDAANRLDYHKTVAAQAMGPLVEHPTLAEPRIVRPALTDLPPDARVPVLIAGASFGFEASHVEGLVQLAEELATSNDPAVVRILDQTVALIVPLMNPDGREMSIREWHDHPLSSGSEGVGNFYHVLINRDFRHLSQPESRAIVDLVDDWHPFVVWDVHEDAFVLAWKFAEVCLAPPTEFDAPPGIDPALMDEAARFGARIAARWDDAGFNYLYHPEGRHGWITAEEGQPDPMSGSAGRLTLAMGFRGIPSFITESSRTLGAQTWEDRNREKVLAGLAVLETVADDPEQLVHAVQSVRGRALAQGTANGGFFLIPTDQDPALIRQAVCVLRGHGVALYRSDTDPSMLVVPMSQPDAHAIEALLSVDFAQHDALPMAYGLRVIPSTALDSAARRRWLAAPLTPVGLTDVPSRSRVGAAPPVRHFAIPNSEHGIALVNRLLRLPTTNVRWNPSASGGSAFLVQLNGATTTLEYAARDLLVGCTPLAEAAFAAGVPVRLPRVGVYAGQGVNHHDAASLGSIEWLLARWGFPMLLLDAEQIDDAVLQNLDILVVPNGDAFQIRHGWSSDALWNRWPWDMPGEPQPLTDRALLAIRTFVEGGGHYLGIDAGGGILAGPQFLGLLDFAVATSNHGLGLVDLHIEQPSSPLFAGLSGSWGREGDWRDGTLSALYWSEGFSHIPGGSVFVPGNGTRVLATYAAAHPVPGPPNMVRTGELTKAGANGAILAGEVGQGMVIVLGIEPTFRCYWHSTFRLLSNAIFAAAES